MADRTSTLTFVARDAASGPITGIDRNLKLLGVTAGRTGTAFGGLGSLMGGTAASFLGAGIAVGALVGFLGNATKAAIADEESIKKLGASLQANVPAFDGNTAAIEANILSKQRLGFSDDELRASLSRLVAATHDVGKAQQIQATAMDLARFRGIDLATATDALVRIEGGQYRALKALGIELAANATQTEALAAVQRVAAGSAEASAGTTAGAMREAAIAIEELSEKIGKSLLPRLGGIARALSNDVIPAMDRFVEASEREIQAVQDFAGDLRNAVLDLASISRATGEAASESTALAQEQRNLARTAVVLAKASKVLAGGQTELFLGLVDVRNSAAGAALAFGYMNAAQRDAASSAKAAVGPLSAEAAWIDIVAFKAAVAARNLNAMNTATFAATQANAQRLKQLGETPDAVKRFGGVAVQPFSKTFAPDAPAIAAAGRVSTAHRGVGAAAQDAAKSISSAFSNAKATADRYFKSVHDSNLKAIKTAHERATAEIAAERRAVSARLTERKRLNAEPVTAAEQALASVERAQQERNLRERLGEAQAGTFNAETGSFDIDQRAVRDASEALSSFLAQVDIDRLRVEQATADALADLDAVNANLALDKKQTAADRTELLATAAENKRYKAEETAYAKRETALEIHLGKVKASHSRVMREINALYADFGIGDKAKAGGGGVSIAPGAIVISGVTDPDEVARLVLASLRRELTRQNMTLA